MFRTWKVNDRSPTLNINGIEHGSLFPASGSYYELQYFTIQFFHNLVSENKFIEFLSCDLYYNRS